MNGNKQAIVFKRTSIFTKKLYFFYQILSALLLSGDIESNPGPFHGMYHFTNFKFRT